MTGNAGMLVELRESTTVIDSVADREAFMRMGMAEGWSRSLDRLEERLAKA